MAQIKITKEELRHDEFLESTDKALKWLKEHLTTIIVVLAALLVVYVSLTVYRSHRRAVMAEANDLLTQAEDLYQEAVTQHEWATPERTETMRRVVDLTRQIRDEFPGSAIAHQALFLQGSAYFQAGDSLSIGGVAENTEDAVDAFTRYTAEAESSWDRAKGNYGLAYAQENAFFLTNDVQRLRDATVAYENVINEEDARFLRYEAMLGQARLFAFQGQTEEAERLYRQVLEARNDSIPALEPEASRGDELLHALRQLRAQTSLAQTARLELTRLGVDVDEDYPLVAPREE